MRNLFFALVVVLSCSGGRSAAATFYIDLGAEKEPGAFQQIDNTEYGTVGYYELGFCSAKKTFGQFCGYLGHRSFIDRPDARSGHEPAGIKWRYEFDL